MLPATLNFGSYAEEFYAHSGSISTRESKSAQCLIPYKFNINVVNTSPRLVYTYIDEITGEVKDIRFHAVKNGDGTLSQVDFDNIAYNAYDKIELPSYAYVKFIKNQASEVLPLDVIWINVQPYDNLSEQTTATAKIGNNTFGYITHTVTINVFPNQ